VIDINTRNYSHQSSI